MGGLVFARVMQMHGLDVVVYERDESPVARSQGGVLDLHVESGQWALEVAGLADDFKRLARPEGEDMRILTKEGVVLWDQVGEEPSMHRPEIDRPVLRRLLIDALKPGTIRWNHQLVAVAPTGQRNHCLRFADGTQVISEVVIGADGANSQVRALVTDAVPAYSGVSFIELGIADVQNRFPDVAALVGRGSLFALGDDKGLIAQLNGDGRVRIYVALRMAEGAFESLGIQFGNTAATRAGLLSQFSDWAPSLRRLIEVCDDEFIPRAVTAMPVGITWPNKPGVTLLGDAAHQMSPFAGAGANVAMQDGAALALALVGADDLHTAIADFERAMFARAHECAEASAQGMETCISPDGAHRLAEQMKQHAEI